MVRMQRNLLLLVLLAELLAPNIMLGQDTLPPADSVSETLPVMPRVLASQPAEGVAQSPTVPSAVPASFLAPSLVPPLTPEGPPKENGVLGPPGQMIGWYATLDGALLVPHLNSHLNSGSNIKAPFLTPSTPTGSVQTSLPP